jgi:hypothetical protein
MSLHGHAHVRWMHSAAHMHVYTRTCDTFRSQAPVTALGFRICVGLKESCVLPSMSQVYVESTLNLLRPLVPHVSVYPCVCVCVYVASSSSSLKLLLSQLRGIPCLASCADSCGNADIKYHACACGNIKHQLLSRAPRLTQTRTHTHTRHLLDIIGLLSRDAQGCEKLRDGSAMRVVLGCLWEEDTDVVLRTGKVAASLAQHPAGLSLLFSSNALQKITEALEDHRLHIRCVSLGGPAANLSMHTRVWNVEVPRAPE